VSQDWFADNAPPETGGDWFEQNAPGSRSAMRNYAPGVPKPAIDMQGSYTAQALNPTASVASPGEASYVAEADPESQARMLGAAAVGVGGAGVAAAGVSRSTAGVLAKWGLGSAIGLHQAIGLYRDLKKIYEGAE
jgi:hypothetical protein